MLASAKGSPNGRRLAQDEAETAAETIVAAGSVAAAKAAKGPPLAMAGVVFNLAICRPPVRGVIRHCRITASGYQPARMTMQALLTHVAHVHQLTCGIGWLVAN